MGPLPKNLRPEASEAWRLAEARVLRVLEALGGSFVRVLRVREAPGRDTFREPMSPGGSAREDLTRAGGGKVGRGGEGGSGARVLRVLEALGGSFVCILRVWRGSGGLQILRT